MTAPHPDDARILANYVRVRSTALQAWAARPEAGEPLAADSHRANLGVSSSRTELLPPAARRVYDDFAEAELGTLSLGRPSLVAVNANWSQRHVLA